MLIRLAKAADEASIRDCALLAYSRYVPVIGRDPAPMTADVAAQIAAGCVNLATDEAGQTVGYITFYPSGDRMFLESVAVVPEAAGQGIGKTLIAYCEDTARAKGLTAVRLYTNAKMTENLSIYPKLGYTEVDRSTENGFDRVYFEKRLT